MEEKAREVSAIIRRNEWPLNISAMNTGSGWLILRRDMNGRILYYGRHNSGEWPEDVSASERFISEEQIHSVLMRQQGWNDQTKEVQILGLQRSGTTWLHELLEHNFNCRIVYKVNKHVPSRRMDPNTPTILITKNPYAWLISIHRAWKNRNREAAMERQRTGEKQYLPWGPCAPKQFRDFLYMPFYYAQVGLAQSPIHYWNIIHSLWVKRSIPSLRQATTIRYIDLLISLPATLNRIEGELALERRHVWFEDCELETGPRNYDPWNPPRNFKRKEDYIKHHYMQDYTEVDIKRVNNTIDKTLVMKLGYRLTGVSNDR